MNFLFVLYFVLLMLNIKNPSINVGVNISAADVVLGLFFLYFVTRATWKKNPAKKILIEKFRLIFFLLFVYYLFIICYSLLQGYNMNQIFGRFRNLFIYPLVFFPAIYLINTCEDIEKIIAYTRYFFILAAVLNIIHLFYPLSLLRDERFEAGLTYFRVMNLEVGLIAVLVFVHAQAEYLFKRNRLLNLLLIALGLVAVIASQNRSILISFILAILLVLWLGFRQGKIRLRVFTLVVLALGGLLISLLVLMNSPYWARFEKRYTIFSDELAGRRHFSTAEIRMGRAWEALKRWTEDPVIGSGWGGQGDIYHIYRFDGSYITTVYGTPHNYYAALLEQTGAIGFLLMAFFLFSVYRVSKPRRPISKVNIGRYSLFFFFLISLVFALVNVNLYGTSAFIMVSFFLWGASASSYFLYHDERKGLRVKVWKKG